MDIQEKILDKLESVDDKVSAVTVEQAVFREKLLGIELKMDEGRKRNMEAQADLKNYVSSIAPRVDEKAEEVECRRRYDYMRSEIKKQKKAIFLIFLLLGGGIVTTAMTAEGRGIIRQLLGLILGML